MIKDPTKCNELNNYLADNTGANMFVRLLVMYCNLFLIEMVGIPKCFVTQMRVTKVSIICISQ